MFFELCRHLVHGISIAVYYEGLLEWLRRVKLYTHSYGHVSE